MRKLLILTLALTVVLGVFAQDKLTSSTQMFLYHRAQQAQRATLPPVSPSGRHPLSAALRSNINPKFDAKKMQIWAEPVIIDGVEMIDAFITVDDINNLSPLEAKGVIVEAKFTDFITSKIPIGRIVEISELDCVKQIEVSRMARVKTDIASDITNTTKVWNGTDNGLPENFKGEGVVVGVIDQGIDFQHIAFKDENGNYRIKAAYLSGATSGGSTVTLNGRTISGRQYTGSQLSSLTYDVNDGSHGTHTSSTAGGSTVTVDANHVYTGMAPKSDLVLCGLSSLSNTNIANSVKYINNYATTNNQPCVINISLGSNYGPCDGTGYLTQAYSDFTGNGEAEGRVICLAAGNEGEIIEHISGTATSSTPICTSLEFNIYSDVLDGCSYEYGYTDDTYDIPSAYTIWSQTANVPLKFRPVIIDKSNNSIVYTYNSIVTPTSSNGSTYSLGSNYLKYNSGAASIVIARSLDEYSNKYCYSISVNSDNQNDVTEVGDNYFPHYAVGLLIYSDTDTRVDCWAEYPSSYMSPTYAGTYGGNSFVSGNYDCSIGDDVPAKGVISIGAYVERRVVTTSGGTSYTASEYTIGDIAPFSSFSTNSPDGKIYPHICAPGAVLTAGVNRYDTSNYPSSSTTADEYMTIINHSDGSRYGSMSGTSMATPTASGIVALWLQADPTLTANRVMEIMDATGVRDNYVTNGSNKTHFGRWGKIDALAGIDEILGNTLGTPALDAAGSVGTDRFTASWSAVEGADSYTLEIGKAAAEPTTVDDVLTRTTTGVTGTQYSSWSGKTGASGAVYAGQSAGGNESIQLRSSNSNSGIISTTSGGKIKKVTVTWNSNTSNGNKLDVYGSNTVYTSPTQLYGNSIVGTKLGSITKGTSTELEITGDYAYIGVRSNSGALYLTDITFTWDKSSTTSSGAPRLRAMSDVTDGDVRTISGITGTSHVVTGLDAGATYKFKVKAVSGTDESRWSNEETVTTLEGDPVPEFDVEPSSLTMKATVGESATATVDVYGLNLTQNASLTIGGTDASLFSVTPNTLTPAQAAELTTVTVTYSPTAVGTHTATLTIASEGATSVVIPITATATAAPVVTPTLVVVGDATVAVAATVGQSATETFSVRGSNLKGGVTLTLDNENYFAINPTTIAKADAEEGAEVTVTYSPAVAGTHTATVTISSDGAESETVTLNGTATTPPDPTADRTFKLATKLSDLDGVTEIILVNPDGQTDNSGSVAMSTQNTNNRAATSITLSDNNNIATVPANNTSIVVLTLGKTTMTDDNSTTVYTFYDEAKSGYLYAASSSRNYLKTQTTLDDNVKATISIDSDGAATILFQGEYTRNSLRYNDDKESGNLFACYAETSDFPRAYIYYYEGNVEPTPELAVDPASLTFDEQYTGVSTQKTFSVSGANLSGDVTLSVSGNYFTVEPSTLTPTNGTLESTTVTVTYLPTAVGAHTATVTISSAGATSAEVALSGSAVLQKAVPVMLPAVTETEVGDTWFVAKWTDATPAANVSSYTLYVNKVEETPEPEPETGVWLAKEDFSNFEGAVNGTEIGTSTNSFDKVMATAGWTGTKVYSYNGALRIGSSGNGGTLKSPYFDLTDYETVTVKVQVSKNNSAADKSLTINLCDGNNNDNIVDTKSQALTQVQVTAADFATAVPEYSFTLDCSSLTTNAYISFSVESSTQANFRYINIYAGSEPSSGAPRLKAVVEDGDASTRTITGISGDTKTYRVSGLTPGAKYDYKVKAVYVDQAESAWSNVEQVELKTLTPHTLAEMVADGTLGVGDSYAIADGNLLAVMLSADGKTLFCKDANGYAQKQSASGSQVDYMVEYGFETPLEYDQSNWVALTSESALSGDLVGHYLTGVSGTVSDLANPSLALAAAPAVGESGSAYLSGTPNRFIPTSFMGASVVESGGKAFFFVAPKPVEVAIVTWACWNGSKFVSVPKTTYTKDGVTSTMNPYNLQGEFTVDTKYLESWPTTLTEDEVYEFTAVITREGGASPAPGRLKSATSAGGYGIYPLSAPTSIGSVGGTVTGITGVNGNGAAVESVTIYNSVGARQSELQRGVNIIVTRYTDGTTRTVKILK